MTGVGGGGGKGAVLWENELGLLKICQSFPAYSHFYKLVGHDQTDNYEYDGKIATYLYYNPRFELS